MERRPGGARRIAKRFMDDALTDRISWNAARTLLEQLRSDPGYPGLDAELRAAIERLLARTPREPPGA
jgi:hypothetical protein